MVGDDLAQALDAVFGEGGHAILAEAVDPKAAVFGEQVDREREKWSHAVSEFFPISRVRLALPRPNLAHPWVPAILGAKKTLKVPMRAKPRAPPALPAPSAACRAVNGFSESIPACSVQGSSAPNHAASHHFPWPTILVFDTETGTVAFRSRDSLLLPGPSCSWANAVEGWFAKLTRQRLKRGVFTSIVELQTAINRFIAEANDTPKPFVWTKSTDAILAAVQRGRQALEAIH